MPSSLVSDTSCLGGEGSGEGITLSLVPDTSFLGGEGSVERDPLIAGVWHQLPRKGGVWGGKPLYWFCFSFLPFLLSYFLTFLNWLWTINGSNGHNCFVLFCNKSTMDTKTGCFVVLPKVTIAKTQSIYIPKYNLGFCNLKNNEQQ